jgi:hypothetical protein
MPGEGPDCGVPEENHACMVYKGELTAPEILIVARQKKSDGSSGENMGELFDGNSRRHLLKTGSAIASKRAPTI